MIAIGLYFVLLISVAVMSSPPKYKESGEFSVIVHEKKLYNETMIVLIFYGEIIVF